MAATKPTSVVLTRAHRDAGLEEIEFAFERWGGSTKNGLHLASPRFGHRIRAEPLQALRESLDVARASGLDFDSACESSVESALYGYRGSVRHDWSIAIRETREVWVSAYLHEPNRQLERWAGVLQPL
jgi:hypothetical protein